jgi:hypothetical protein
MTSFDPTHVDLTHVDLTHVDLTTASQADVICYFQLGEKEYNDHLPARISSYLRYRNRLYSCNILPRHREQETLLEDLSRSLHIRPLLWLRRHRRYGIHLSTRSSL